VCACVCMCVCVCVCARVHTFAYICTQTCTQRYECYYVPFSHSFTLIPLHQYLGPNILFKHSQILFKHSLNTLRILFKYSSNTLQTLFRHSSNKLQLIFMHCTWMRFGCTQEENFEEAAKAAFHAWTPYAIRKCLMGKLLGWPQLY
jgi:hypothetical protein